MAQDSNSGLSNVQLELVSSVEDASRFMSWLGERRPNNAIAIDTETGEFPGNDKSDALSPWKGHLRLVQVGDGITGWSIPWKQWNGVFHEAMNKFDGQLIFHNIAFEYKWFALQSEWKIPWHRAHDTMIMSQVVYPLESAALKRLASKYVDNKAVALQDTLKNAFVDNGWTWGTIPIDYQPYWAYGALDTVLTMRIWEQLNEECGVGRKYSVPYELEMAARRIATQMEMNGARVDLDYSKEMYDKLTQYTGQVKAWGKSTYGRSITSNQQLADIFLSLGAQITEFTNSGQPSVTKDELQKLVRDGSPEVQNLATTVLEQRKYDKLAGSYFSNFLNDNIDGILHPNIKTMGARTGRMSITEPALQTLPSNDPIVRRAFIPRQGEGWGIVSSDLDQVEFRLTAHYSGDYALIELFNEADRTGGDVFTQIMRQVYNDDTLQKADPRRKLIKGTVYGKLYGAGVDKMAITSGVLTSQMKAVVDAFDAAYPGIKNLQEQIGNVGQQRLRKEGQAYVETKTGRRLPADSDRIYSLTNYLIQATAAEIFKQNLIKLDQQDLTDFMVVPVHDEIVLDVPVKDAEEIKTVVREAMTTREDWSVPLTADVEGPFDNWGRKYEEKH